MSEIYQIFEVKTYNYPDDKGELKKYLGTWEKIDNNIRELRWDLHEYEVEPGEDICSTIKKNGKYSYIFEGLDEYTQVKLEAVKTNQIRGAYYPRIFKPICTDDDLEIIVPIRVNKVEDLLLINNLPYDENHLIKSLEQLSTLIELLNRIFKTVFPCAENYNTYGFDIRNLIILACTEFESQFIGIFKENDIHPLNRYYRTKDYVRLKDELKLGDYEIKFTYYPELSSFSPFSNWKEENPTGSLDWFSNYNAIKHDRDNEFEKSRLVDLISSISACYIIILAQYGELPMINEILKNYLKIEKRPNWDNSEKYLRPFREEEWEINKYNG